MVFEQHSILQRKLAEDARKKQEQEEEEKKKKAAEEKVQEKARLAAATCSFMQTGVRERERGAAMPGMLT